MAIPGGYISSTVLFAALLSTPLAARAQHAAPSMARTLVGDGKHDDTEAIQALLDSQKTLVYLPPPPKHYLISRPLQIHSNRTLQLNRFTVIRLKNGSDCLMITNDDHDGGIYEMSRGPIEDVAVDGLWAKDGYTAVRLLSAGSPIRRIRLANIFGTYRYNVVSFTNHKVHPGSKSTFEDISIRGLFCAKSGMGMKYAPAKPGRSLYSLIWVEAPAVVSVLTIAELHRTESVWPAATIFIEPGALVKSLQLTQATILNHIPGPLDLLVNRGVIEYLSLSQMKVAASPGPARGAVIRTSGTLKEQSFQQLSAVNTAAEVLEELSTPESP